jgi:FixJ family two-component response regulator
MPGMSGPELQQELARLKSAIPIVFIAASDDISIPRLLQRGAVACLTKPFSEAAIFEAVNTALTRE